MTTRVSHIERIYKNNDPDSDTWIDVERIDRMSFVSNSGQVAHWIFHWEEFDAARAAKKQIADPNDPDNFIEVPVRDTVKVHTSYGQGYVHHFLNGRSNLSRETHSRRIYNHQIKAGYLVGNTPPADPNIYLDSLGDQDKTQYVEVELLDNYWTSQTEDRTPFGKRKPPTIQGQKKRWLLGDKSVDPLLNEPIKEGDTEDPGFIPTHNPDGIVTIDPPWRLDPLQNIVNVQWGGLALFASGAFNFTGSAPAVLRYAEVKNRVDTIEWVSAGDPGFGGGEFPHGGEATGFAGGLVGADEEGKGGSMVFVAVGANTRGSSHAQGIIMASKDGKTWTKVFTGRLYGSTPVAAESSVWAVTFDGSKFWAAAHETDRGDVSETNEHDILLNSSDGFSWTEAGRNTINFTAWPSYNPSQGLLTPHLSTKFKDANGNGVPSGLWGEDKANGLALAPDPIPWGPDFLFGQGTFIIDPPTRVSGPVSTDPTAPPPPSAEVGIPCTCVAFAGGVWMAGGGDANVAQSAYSFDGGKTWKPSTVAGVSGAMSGIAGGKVKPSE